MGDRAVQADPINDMESNKKYLEKGSKAMAALRKIVIDPKWLNTLHYYVKFRYLPGASGRIC